MIDHQHKWIKLNHQQKETIRNFKNIPNVVDSFRKHENQKKKKMKKIEIMLHRQNYCRTELNLKNQTFSISILYRILIQEIFFPFSKLSLWKKVYQNKLKSAWLWELKVTGTILNIKDINDNYHYILIYNVYT